MDKGNPQKMDLIHALYLNECAYFLCFSCVLFLLSTLVQLCFFQFLQVASNRPQSLFLSLGKVFIWHCRSLLTGTWHGANILSLSLFPLLHSDFTSLCVSWVCFVFVIFCFGFVFSALSPMHPHSYLDTFSCLDYSWAARQQRNGRPVVSSLQRTPHRERAATTTTLICIWVYFLF